jgi:hypothetical protein
LARFRYLPLLLLFTLACSLLADPPRPILPTPQATVPPFPIDGGPLGTPFADPVCSVAPALDPDIEALMNAVSRQNLLAYVQTMEGFGTRHIFSDTASPTAGIGAARTWIYNEFIRVGNNRLQVRFDDFPAVFNGLTTNQQNIVATLPGVSAYPGILVLTAHYDSRTFDMADGSSFAPGANDNATGVAVLLEVARLLSSRTWNQTVVFVAFAAEEQGTIGSRHFVQDELTSGSIFMANLNNDIVGGRAGIAQSVRIFSLGPDTSTHRQLARYIDLVSGLYLPVFGVQLQDALDREGRYSDHREFVNVNAPAVRITESEEDLTVQHTNLDTANRIDYDYLFQVVQLNLVTAANMIGAPPPPPAPAVTAMASAGTYLLTWQPDPIAAGYAISFRPLGAAQYAPFRFVCANQAGNVVLTGFDPQITYAVSLAALDVNGRVSGFSAEALVGPAP